MTKSTQLYEQTFSRYRMSRSQAYKEGVLAELKHRFSESDLKCPYQLGSALADAWIAGNDEGSAIFFTYLNEKTQTEKIKRALGTLESVPGSKGADSEISSFKMA